MSIKALLFKFIYIPVALFIIFNSCEADRESRSIVNQWNDKKIDLKSLSVSLEQDSTWKEAIDHKFKIFTIIGTNNCSECRLKLFDWKRIITHVDSISNNVSCIFIAPSTDSIFIEALKIKNKFYHHIFYDNTNKIIISHQLPQKARFQTFLLDQNNRVLLIGNPAGNDKLWDLYKQIITSK